MKKKTNESNTNIIIIVMILLIIIGIIVLYKFNLIYLQFNPETDVCLKWEYCFYGQVTKNRYCFPDYPEELSEDKICKDWRPKTKCELNPEAEGCICDELSEFKCHFDIIHNYKLHYAYIWNESEEPFEEWCLNNGGELINKCIKSHLPNECEKGDINWIWDCGFNWEINTTDPDVDDLITCKQSSNCNVICTEKICRKKELKDYDCNALKKAILLNWNYCKKENKFVKGNWCNWKNYPIQTPEIYNIAIEKGCEI